MPAASIGSTSSARGATLDGARRLELGDDLRDSPRSPSSDQLERLLIVEGLDRSREPDRNVLGLHDTSEPVDDFRELCHALSSLPGRRGAPREPVADSARRRPDSPRDLAVGQMRDLVDANNLFRERTRHDPQTSCPVANPSIFRPGETAPAVITHANVSVLVNAPCPGRPVTEADVAGEIQLVREVLDSVAPEWSIKGSAAPTDGHRARLLDLDDLVVHEAIALAAAKLQSPHRRRQ